MNSIEAVGEPTGVNAISSLPEERTDAKGWLTQGVRTLVATLVVDAAAAEMSRRPVHHAYCRKRL